VDIKSLEELRQPDQRTLRFAPLGLAMGGTMRPEDAAVFQQEVISHAELVPGVAEGTRNTFERLRMLYAYGVLCYDMFTAVEDLAHLVIEQALRDRILEFYGGSVPFEDASGQPHPVEASRYEELYEEIRKANRLRRPQRWRLKLRRTGELIYFDGMLDSLLRWARGEGLLRGQRNRQFEPLLKSFRNHVAHGTGDHLVMPVNTARTLSDLAEVINQLWGSSTPGGRLYPAPIAREIQAVAWGPDGSVLTGLTGNFSPRQEHDDWTYILVRAVLHDPGLMHFDAQYETTTYPCELLWGPGSWQDADEWLKEEQPEPDEVEILDRLFLLQHHENRLYLPRSLDIAESLTGDQQEGRWHLVRADFSRDAYAHTRGVVADGSTCQGTGPCGQCAAETLGVGVWQEMIGLATASGITVRRQPAAPDVRVPSLRSWPRYKEIIES
jgi:hypothetical protein